MVVLERTGMSFHEEMARRQKSPCKRDLYHGR